MKRIGLPRYLVPTVAGTHASVARMLISVPATEAGDHDGAATWWNRIREVDPLNSAVATSFVRSLAAAGDPAGALREARAHESLLSVELGQRPGSAFCELVEQLRRSAVHT